MKSERTMPEDSRGSIAEPTAEEVDELQQMLANLALSASESVIRHGRTVEMVVSVWESEEREDDFDAVISAFRPDLTRLSLRDLVVTADCRTAAQTIRRFSDPIRRGGLAIDGLPRDAECLLNAGVRWPLWVKIRQALKQIASIFIPLGRIALPPQPVEAFAAGEEEAAVPSPPPEPHVFESEDGKLTAVIHQTESGRTAIAVQTEDESLAGSSVLVSFVRESGVVAHELTLVLTPARERDNVWEGRWEGPLEPGPYECVLTLSAEPGDR